MPFQTTNRRPTPTATRPYCEVGVRSLSISEPPPRGGGYWGLRLQALSALLLIALLAAVPIAAQDEPEPVELPEQKEPVQVELSPLVTRLLDDDLLSDEQRRAVKIFHGQWDGLGELPRESALRLMVMRQEVDRRRLEDLTQTFEDPDHKHDKTLSIARAYLLGGRPDMAVVALSSIADNATPYDWLIVAQGYEDMGEYPRAIEMIAPIREQALKDTDAFSTAEDLTAAAEAVVMLARLEGRPAADFHLANRLLAKARDEADPLYWPAYVAEAELLWAKGNPRQAMDAVTQALSLNPKSSEAWYLFGTMRSRFFDFDAAERAVKELREINDKHPLGKALAVQIALRQKDVEKASRVITSALEDYPTHRKLLALNAAVQAMLYEQGALQPALDRFAELAPNNPLALYHVGQALADARQYAPAEPHLKNAIRLMPGWSAPQLALGELYMQWGKLDKAATQLQTASSLDPFHKEITNQLLVANEMLGYDTIQRDQFIVRYLPGVDEVLARDVAMHMGDMVERFIERFQHDPPALTQVDLMPDDQHFAVRITGMPDIWTIAACTGDVIAMTPPRPGPKRAYGAYNWLNVMGHEYTHVVNLSQTDNRVPHWFTEGCAVQMETTGRLWSQYALLADCYNNDKLFDYDEINWGFIRPTEDYHRPLAYAQSAWIMQYIEEVHGWDKALEMLALYRQGVGEHAVLERVFGLEPEAFMIKFRAWAGEQVKAWGMATYGKEPDDAEVKAILSSEDLSEVDPERIDALVAKHPDEPDLLKLRAMAALERDEQGPSLRYIKQYQQARPVDPWSDRQLARLALQQQASQTALQSLRVLDRIEGDAPEYAVELARVYRARKDYDKALHFAERALLREPYNATYRESAATIAVQQGDLSRAAFHIESLELLEPGRAMHPKRLAVIYQRLGREADAEAARHRVKSLELLRK